MIYALLWYSKSDEGFEIPSTIDKELVHMANLKTSYMGLSLDNPIVAASSPLTSNIDSLKRLEDAGVGAVVLKSIFEEQISEDARSTIEAMDSYLTGAEAYNFIYNSSQDHYIDQYLELVEKAKKSLSIPVIASLNGAGDGSWLGEYASRYIHCGADAFELNHYLIAADAKIEGAEIERQYIAFVEAAKKEISLPISLKIGPFFSSLSNMIHMFDQMELDGIVLFNNFFNPDIDIEAIKMTGGGILSDANDYLATLRWTALMSAELDHLQICSSGGIHDGKTLIKMLLAGAQVVQVCSVLLTDGLPSVAKMKEELSSWMDRHGFSELSDFRGKLAQERMDDPCQWERTQYVKSLLGKEA